jgi:hypothetical protein
MWSPIPLDHLLALIEQSVAEMSAAERRLWDLVRVPPVKWALHPWGDQGGGFWVVGLVGERVVWYNDIEDGFNISRYGEYGTIRDYRCDQGASSRSSGACSTRSNPAKCRAVSAHRDRLTSPSNEAMQRTRWRGPLIWVVRRTSEASSAMGSRSDVPSEPSGCSPDRETETGGCVTLLDFVLMVSGAWALPCAVKAAVGRESWLVTAALVAGSAGGILWAWYCKRFEWFLHERLCGVGSGPQRHIGYRQLQVMYLGVLVLSVLLQYALYRALCLMLRAGG